MTPDEVTFRAGTMSDTSVCMFLSTIDDTDLEGEHEFTVSAVSATPMTSPNIVVIGTPSSVIVTLLDNESTLLVVNRLKQGVRNTRGDNLG